MQMREVTSGELIDIAASILKRHIANGRVFGDVGAALPSEAGYIYTGVSVNTPSWGLCAERSAISAMITAGEYRIRKIVAVWKEEPPGRLYILPPCGVCREFMRNVDENNLETEVVLGRLKLAKLKELLPLHDWPKPLD